MSSSWHALDVLETQVTLSGASFLVALLSDKVVGHAFALERDDGVMMLSRLYVLPVHQRQGVGKQLWAAILERHPGAARVQLVVEARNTKGLAFYGRHGFVVVGEIKEEGSRSLCMEKLVNMT